MDMKDGDPKGELETKIKVENLKTDNAKFF